MLLYLLGWCLLSWPAVTQLGSEFFHNAGDGHQNAWNIWWVRTALTERFVSPYWCDLAYHPDGTTLIGQTMHPFNGLASIPLSAFLSDVALYNTLVVLSFMLGGWTCYLLARRLGAGRWAGWFAGAAFTYSHFHFAHALGHMQLVSLQFVPLFLWSWLRLLADPGLARGLLAAAVLGLVTACDLYLTFYCVVFGAGLWLHDALTRRSLRHQRSVPVVVGLGSFVLATAATTGMLLVALLLQNGLDPLMNAHNPYDFCLDALAPFIPGGHWALGEYTRGYWGDLPELPVEGDVYVGWIPLLAAACALFRAGREGRRDLWIWLWLGLVAYLLALGPCLQIAGCKLPSVPMPYQLLEWLPGMKLAGMPSRFGVMIVLSVAVLSAFGIGRLLRFLRLRPLQVLALLLFAVEVWPAPQITTRPDNPDWVQALRVLPPGAIHTVDLGTGDELYYQTRHGRPILTGYLTRPTQTRLHRQHRIDTLVNESRFAEVLRRYQARYLILPHYRIVPEIFGQVRPIFAGAKMGIWALPEDPGPSLLAR
jgi:hypothetical protein